MEWAKRIVTVLIVVVIFYFLVSSLANNWSKIPFSSLRFEPASLIISYFLLLVNFVLFVLGWQQIILKLGGDISFRKAFWVLAASQTAKYVPGGIWFALGRIQMGKSPATRSEIIAVSLIIETALTMLVGIILFGVGVVVSRAQTGVNIVFLLLALVIFALLMYPSVITTLLNAALKISKRSPVVITISYPSILGISTYFFGLWAFQILGFYFLINAICPLTISLIFRLTAVYTLSWMAGFLVLLAPSGLGVREGVMTLMLSPVLPAPLAVAISLISRGWITIFEIIVFLVGFVIRKRNQDHGRESIDNA